MRKEQTARDLLPSSFAFVCSSFSRLSMVYNAWGEFLSLPSLQIQDGSSIRPESPLLRTPRNIKGSLLWRFSGITITLCLLAVAVRFGFSSPPSDHLEAQQHANQGYELAQKGNLREAENELRRAAELAPEDPSILAGLGGILGRQQKSSSIQPGSRIILIWVRFWQV